MAYLHFEDSAEQLNKKSGLLGVSGESLDTRILMEHYKSNPRAKLAMDMFSYRIRKAGGSHLAALGSAEAIIFGGGIGENAEFIREYVCEGVALFWSRNRCRSQSNPDRYRGKALDEHLKDCSVGHSYRRSNADCTALV